MERRFQVRLVELLRDAEVRPGWLRGVQTRLENFLLPFLAGLLTPEQQTNTRQYIQGLVSDLGSKDVESIAYLHDRERQGLQKYIGQSEWDHGPLLAELTRQVAAELGEPDGVMVFDPSTFPKKGTESVGVARQWCGRLGKVENCQVGIYLGYVSRREHALLDFRLYLPEAWTKSRKRMRKAGVPEGTRFQTRHELILEMLETRGEMLPHAWVSGDDELGRSSWFRCELQKRNENYLLAVPSNTLIRDLVADPPPYAGRGKVPKSPFVRVERWCRALPQSAWQQIEVRDGEKGPLVVEAARGVVQAKTEGKPSEVVEQLVVVRERQGDGVWKHDYLLSNAPLETPLAEFARVFKAQHRIEESLQRAKSEAGLADYQVRTWEGWHHHQALSLIATWFLTRETRREKNPDPRVDRAAGACDDRRAFEPVAQASRPGTPAASNDPPSQAERGSTTLPLATTQPLATTTV
jgi:SRSO17 transposase